MSPLIIETRTLGRKTPLLDRWSISVPPEWGGDGGDGLTLRELITRVVRAEVAAFEQRQRARRFVRVLSGRELADSAARGKIDPGGHTVETELDVENAVAAALAGFEDGLYLVILDGAEQKDLDQQVYLVDDSRLVFLRLTFLAGA